LGNEEKRIGWQNCHPFEFRAGETAWGLVDRDHPESSPLAAETATLADLLARGERRAQLRLRPSDAAAWPLTEHDLAVCGHRGTDTIDPTRTSVD